MYIALHKTRGRSHFILRESCTIDAQLTCRDLFDLGPDPSVFITYAGGNAFYFDGAIEDSLSESGVDYDSDELEDLFWPWIRPDIRRALDTFRNRSSRSGYKKMTAREKDRIAAHVHSFDKRRTHYLKFGNMDQGAVENMPANLFKAHVNSSRDEIEQGFLRQEFSLKSHELKSYVYTIFDLQHFFSGILAKKMPHALDQDKVDHFFLEELCRMNKELFNRENRLDDYMVRYLIMFFDHHYANTTLLDDFARAFMFRHRTFGPKPEKAIPLDTACRVFNITKRQLETMTTRNLTRLYRKLAIRFHPDTGGSHEQFVELNAAYKKLSSLI